MRSIQLCLLITLTMLSQISFANHSPGVTIFPQVGITNYSGSSNIDRDSSYGIGLGYQFDNPWAVEYTYLKGSSSFSDLNNTAIDSHLWHINGLYHAFESETIRPYLTFGLGESNVNVRNDFRNTEKQINFGLGLKWRVWENTGVRTELKFYDSEDHSFIRSTIGVGIHHVITNSSRKSKPTISAGSGSSINNDGDGDGVSNSKDQCPNSPAGQVVNKIGCLAQQDRNTDSDSDGVIDAKDRCPNTTNRRNVIDSNGCYVTVRTPVELNVLFKFDFDSYATKPEHNDEVNKIVHFAKRHSGASIELSGHTDSVGASAYNQALSQARVAAVAKLVEMNTRIPNSKISKKSFGESKPKRDNDNFANRRANRRVEGTVKAVTQTSKKK